MCTYSLCCQLLVRRVLLKAVLEYAVQRFEAPRSQQAVNSDHQSCPIHVQFLLTEFAVLRFQQMLCRRAFALCQSGRRQEQTSISSTRKPLKNIRISLVCPPSPYACQSRSHNVHQLTEPHHIQGVANAGPLLCTGHVFEECDIQKRSYGHE